MDADALTPQDREILMEHEWARLIQTRWPKGTRRKTDRVAVLPPSPVAPVSRPGAYRLMTFSRRAARIVAAPMFYARTRERLLDYVQQSRARRGAQASRRLWIEEDGHPAYRMARAYSWRRPCHSGS